MHRLICINGVSFPDATIQEDIVAWKSLGAHTVGEHVRKLRDADWTPGIVALQGSGLRVETLVHPLTLRLDHPSEWESTRIDFCKTIDAAKTLGASSVYTTSGNRGKLTWEAAAQAFSDAMRPVLDYANAQGMRLLIEPTTAMHAEMSIISTLSDTLKLAELSGLGINIDIFHCWSESGLKESIAKAVKVCHLVQVSDYVFGDKSLPARAVIGDGGIALERIIGWILDAGYTGMFDLELNGPRIASEGHLAAARRGAERLDEMLVKLGAR